MRWDDEKDISAKCYQAIADTWIQSTNEHQSWAGSITQKKTKGQIQINRF